MWLFANYSVTVWIESDDPEQAGKYQGSVTSLSSISFFFNLFLKSCVIYSLFILIFLHMYNRWYSQLELNYLPKAPPKLSEIYWIGLARYLSGVGYESSVVLASNVISSGFVREYDGQQGRLLSMRRSVCRTVRNLMGTGGIEGLGHGNLPPACWGLHQQWS